jgi:hypothetical protein
LAVLVDILAQVTLQPLKQGVQQAASLLEVALQSVKPLLQGTRLVVLLLNLALLD